MKRGITSVLVVTTLCITATVLGLTLTPVVVSAEPAQKVRVVNNPEQSVPVYDVDNPALQPFQQYVHLVFDPTQLGGGKTFTVPADKRLVIEFVSGNVALRQGSVSNFTVTTTVNGIIGKHRLVVTSQGPSGGLPISYTVSQNMRVYADPGTTVIVFVNATLGGEGGFDATISGYLVDLP